MNNCITSLLGYQRHVDVDQATGRVDDDDIREALDDLAKARSHLLFISGSLRKDTRFYDGSQRNTLCEDLESAAGRLSSNPSASKVKGLEVKIYLGFSSASEAKLV